ncbi:Zinc finger MYM-type protein 1 [Merluccius polli]|uniref:Zinc finger MYM-type protein 1 n=1 Tax=Merluccius polli TaxID=89951 RepID=A0AA47MIS9_MERPO|nr:Zinc finger MYM-type protein 1 [Merluccius polli]
MTSMIADRDVFRDPAADQREDNERADDSRSGRTGSLLGKNDLGTRKTGPKQPRLDQYPSTSFGKQQRSFQKHWFDLFDWLEYSLSRNSSYCFSCRLFGKLNLRANKDALLNTEGFKNWKRALDSYREHEASVVHKSSLLAWKNYRATLTEGDVVDQMNVGNVAQINERREYMRRIVAVTSFLGKQGIAFRGH